MFRRSVNIVQRARTSWQSMRASAFSTSTSAATEASAGRQVGMVLTSSVVAGSVLGMGYEVYQDVRNLHPSTRASELASTTKYTLKINDNDVNVYVSDTNPDMKDSSEPVVLVAADSLTLHSDLLSELEGDGRRVIAYELELHHTQNTVPVDVSSQSAILSGILNACNVTSPLIVVSGGLDWLSTLHFATKNADHIAGLVLVDPIIPSLPAEATSAQVDAAPVSLRIGVPAGEERGGEESGSPSIRRNFISSPGGNYSPSKAPEVDGDRDTSVARRFLDDLRSNARSNPTDAAAFNLPVALSSWDPLHRLEHLFTGDTHHHLLCGGDHKDVTTTAASMSTNRKEPSIGNVPSASGLAHTRWRLSDDSSVVSTISKSNVPAAAAPSMVPAVADTIDAPSVLLERLYRDRLASGTRKPCLGDMIPSFAQSFGPSYARGFELHVPFTDVKCKIGGDARVTHLDAKVEELNSHCNSMANMNDWMVVLRSLDKVVPVRVHVTSPGETKVDRSTDDSAHYLFEKRMDTRMGKLVTPSSMEVNLRALLQLDADRRLQTWRTILPGRCAPAPACSAASGREVFDPEVNALAKTCEYIASQYQKA